MAAETELSIETMKKDSTNIAKQYDTTHKYAVIVAGGSGTRLWPLSRKDLPKQMQSLISDKTLIDETVSRLEGLLPVENIYISTTENYSENIKKLLPQIPEENIIIEPVARGTVAAFALFAHTIYMRDPKAIIFSLASDHAVTEIDQFQQALVESYLFVEARPQTIALVGIKPDKADTGLGYIKIDKVIQENPLVYSVEKFVEKPTQSVAQSYVNSGEYYWNAAYYCFMASTLKEAYAEADPKIMDSIERYYTTKDTNDFMEVPLRPHEIELINTSIYPLAVVPADFKWSDIGNWHTLHELLSGFEPDSNFSNRAVQHIDMGSQNCLVFTTDKRLVATVGLDDLAIVSTEDVVLVLNKNNTQDIKQLIEMIKDKGLTQYL